MKKFSGINNGSNISDLSSIPLSTMPQLKELTINDNKIKIIEKDDLKMLPNLKKFRFCRNKSFDYFQDGVFSSLAKLKYVNIVRTTHARSFKSIKS
jgi:hypothetical protein